MIFNYMVQCFFFFFFFFFLNSTYMGPPIDVQGEFVGTLQDYLINT